MMSIKKLAGGVCLKRVNRELAAWLSLCHEFLQSGAATKKAPLLAALILDQYSTVRVYKRSLFLGVYKKSIKTNNSSCTQSSDNPIQVAGILF